MPTFLPSSPLKCSQSKILLVGLQGNGDWDVLNFRSSSAWISVSDLFCVLTKAVNQSLCSNWSNLSEQFSSCLNNKHTGLSEVDSALSIDVTWTWCQWRMLHSKQRSRSRYYKSLYFSISLNVSSLLLFSLPVNCFLICYWVMPIQRHLVLRSPAHRLKGFRILTDCKIYSSHLRPWSQKRESTSFWGTHLNECGLECSLGTVRRLVGTIYSVHIRVTRLSFFSIFSVY